MTGQLLRNASIEAHATPGFAVLMGTKAILGAVSIRYLSAIPAGDGVTIAKTLEQFGRVRGFVRVADAPETLSVLDLALSKLGLLTCIYLHKDKCACVYFPEYFQHAARTIRFIGEPT